MKKPHAKRLLKTVQKLKSDADSNEREKTAPINALVENNESVSGNLDKPENKRVSL